MRKFYGICAIVLPLIFSLSAMAQGSLLDQLNQEAPKTANYVQGTFKGLRIVTGQSIETVGKNNLVFMLGHRFGRVTGSYKQFFGLDNATMRMGLEYGILKNLTVGIGRSTFQKTIDGFVKYRPLTQCTGAKKYPLSLALFASMAITTEPFADANRKNFVTSKFYYTFQIMLARKFHEYFSLQLNPTMVHRNLVATTADKNDVFSLGAGARVKLSRSVTFNAEYYYVFPGQIKSTFNGEKIRNPLQLGIDIETGGHVFQIHLSNSRGMIEKHFITETTGNWLKGEIQIGFNMSRNFDFAGMRGNHVSKKKKNA